MARRVGRRREVVERGQWLSGGLDGVAGLFQQVSVLIGPARASDLAVLIGWGEPTIKLGRELQARGRGRDDHAHPGGAEDTSERIARAASIVRTRTDAPIVVRPRDARTSPRAGGDLGLLLPRRGHCPRPGTGAPQSGRASMARDTVLLRESFPIMTQVVTGDGTKGEGLGGQADGPGHPPAGVGSA
ncbi:hypothetical protein [Pseudonocardia asaccharolytica]|uniref:hypothetical protein n=1 Tax=Pseudonocardia asaccharolytica TaxID=54010 RepID=UPI00146D9475|nr:hypothetical protein [Pseudonocardia asaccharolytica]